MILEMKVPSPGESITEVEIATWLVADGDYVEKDQIIAELDSDKATLELPAEEGGVIKLKVEDREQLALVSLDSRSRAFDSETELTIKQANFTIKLVKPQNNSFVSTIRHKLMWGLDKRS